MATHFLDIRNRIRDLRAAEEGAREEKERCLKEGDLDGVKRWQKAEDTARLEADRLEASLRD